MRTSLRPPLASLLGMLVGSMSAPLAGAGQIATDRPDFVESSLTVGRRAVQIETSFSLDDVGWSTPTLLRLGIGETWEVRFESAVVAGLRTDPGGAGSQTLAEADIGLKWHTGDQAGAVPSTAVLFHAGLPLPAGDPDDSGSGPSLRMVAEWALPGRLALGLMPGLSLPREGEDRHLRGIVGVVLGRELNSTLRTFGEVAVEGRITTVNTGLALLVGSNTQFDVGLSLGAGGGGPAKTMALGFSHRTGW